MPSRTDEEGDHRMGDAPSNTADGGSEAVSPTSEMFDFGPSRLRVLPGSTDTAASFEFQKEDHTLGNALRYVIMKNPAVEFCGYTIPHPSEARMNIRIQTYDNVSVYDVLRKGLDDLNDLCDVVLEKFTEARDEFVAK